MADTNRSDSNIDVKRDQQTPQRTPQHATPAHSSALRGETRPAPLDPFQAMRREMDRMFDRFFGRGFGLPSAWRMSETEPLWRGGEEGFAFSAPAIDFAEDESAYHLAAELPGLSEKGINLSLSDDLLTISGEKREERQEQEKDKNYHYSERRFGSFRRVIQLPQHIDRDKIEANFRNGVLNVTLPKSHDARQPQRKIDIKAQ
jgi:HSP20 family protein